MKKIALLASLAIFLLSTNIVLADESSANAKKDEGGLYSYSENDIPEVFFFPPEKARWNGYKVTMKEWYMLTDLQKEKFINEYFGELKNQYNMSIEAAGLDYMKALNVFSYYSNDKSLNQPSTKFIDKMLTGQGKIPSENK